MAHSLGGVAAVPGEAHPHRGRVAGRFDRGAELLAEQAGGSVAPGRVDDADSQDTGAEGELEPVGVSSATRRPWSMTAIRSESWSASSRYWVVNSTVVPSATAARMTSQTKPRLRGRARRRLVEDEQVRGDDQPGRDVEPAPHAAGVGRHDAAAGVGEAEHHEQLLDSRDRRATSEPAQPGLELEVLPAGEVVVHGRELPRHAQAFADGVGVAPRVVPEDSHVAEVGVVSVVIMRIVVVLPAPLGPSSPSTEPAGTLRLRRSTARVRPNVLTRAVASTARSMAFIRDSFGGKGSWVSSCRRSSITGAVSGVAPGVTLHRPTHDVATVPPYSQRGSRHLLPW